MKITISLLLIFLSYFTGNAIAGDEDFPTPFNTDPAGGDGPVSAESAAQSFELPDGFEVSVFASEPQVQNPIGMAWDQKGRLWVAENYTYGSSKVRFQLGLRDRVLVFEDEDHDGVADKRIVFTDKVQMLTSVELGRGGVWLMCPPRVLFIPDRDGDLIPDGEPEVVLDGFTVGQGNYHNFANGLRWGPDGWLYGRCGHSCPGSLGVPGTPDEARVPIKGGIWRFHPVRKVVEVLSHGTVNPWGHDWDEHGELFFINTVIGHLWHMIPGAHFKESGGQSTNRFVYDRIGQHAHHFHYDRGKGWGQSRDGAANDFGGGHSHIGMAIYQADHLPQSWRGKLLTWNQHGRRANVERLERSGSGYVGKREPDVFLSGDSWFRGLDIRTGPDGALYALDWSDTGECHEHTGVHRTSGRIYRFSHGVPTTPDFSLLGEVWPRGGPDVKTHPFARIVRHPNVWFYRRWLESLPAQSNSAPAPVIIALRNILSEDTSTAHRLRALWALHLLGESDPLPLLDDPDEHVRTWAIRLLTDEWPLDTILGPNTARPPIGDAMLEVKLVEMAASDRSGLVRLALASALQRLPVASRPKLAQTLASHAGDASDHNLPHMVWFGLTPVVERAPAALVDIAKSTTWPKLQRWIARAIGSNIGERLALVEAMLDLAAADPDGKGPHILDGLTDAYRGWRNAPRPRNWGRVAAALGNSEPVRKLAVLFGDGVALGELKAIVLDEKADTGARQAALRTLIENRPADLRETCELLLDTRRLNRIAVRGLALFDDPAIGLHLAGNYKKLFRATERPPVIDVLTSRPGWARDLLVGIDVGRIPRADLTPFHARQIQSFGNEELTQLLHKAWGRLGSTDEGKTKRIDELKKALTPDALAAADRSNGRVLFNSVCASCHQLYGQGQKFGPDLTGSGRAEIDYLLENIVSPSAVVPSDYTMTSVTLEDGRVLAGVIAEENERTLTMRMLTEETTVEKSEITRRGRLPVSIMPEGLLDALGEGGARDLLAYLMHPRQVDLPKESPSNGE